MNPRTPRTGLVLGFVILAAMGIAGCASDGPDAAAGDNPYAAAALSRTAPWALEAPSGQEPDSVVFDRLVSQYEPARFNHESHASMAKMDRGCDTCHHGAEGGPTPACGHCHTVPLDEGSQASLGLKGALHLQCLRCHRECGSRNDCTACHFKRGESAAAVGSGFGKKAEMLDRKVYETPREKGTQVVFNHGIHAEECGSCSACHRNEACSACHGRAATELPKRVRARGEDPHGRCFPCHGKDTDLEFDCSDCHEKK